MLCQWFPLVGTVHAEFICDESNGNCGDGGSVGSSGKEMTIRQPGALPPTNPSPSPPKRAPSKNLGHAPQTHPGVTDPRQRGLPSVRRPRFYGRTKATNNSARRSQKPKAMANGELTRAKGMWRSGRVTKPDYHQICNQIHLHEQFVNEGQMEPEAFQIAIGTLMEQLIKSASGSKVRLDQKQRENTEGRQRHDPTGRRPTREPKPRGRGSYGK
jgi:hypothetical protein